jgi:hypothetical protein
MEGVAADVAADGDFGGDLDRGRRGRGLDLGEGGEDSLAQAFGIVRRVELASSLFGDAAHGLPLLAGQGETDDVGGHADVRGVQGARDLAGIAAAGFFAIGNHDDGIGHAFAAG